jgi:hypothetical protein
MTKGVWLLEVDVSFHESFKVVTYDVARGTQIQISAFAA